MRDPFIKKLLFLITVLLVQSISKAQTELYYDEDGKRISQSQFLGSRNYSRNLDLYFTGDTLKIGILVKREREGHLGPEILAELMAYLSKMGGREMGNKNVVINYLPTNAERYRGNQNRSKWDLFESNYLTNLHKGRDLDQLWIASKDWYDLEHFYIDRIPWKIDHEGRLTSLFFKYETRYANFLLLKPTGEYYYYLGEHSKRDIWRKSEEFFN